MTTTHTKTEHKLTVTIHDEDAGGKPIEIKETVDVLVGVIIDQFYKKIKTTRAEGDRLYCIKSGQDVFEHAAQSIGDFASSACPDLIWGWSRKTGGA